MPESKIEPSVYVMLRKGIFRHKGVTYGPREPAGTEITTTADLPKLYPGLFVLKSEANKSSEPVPASIGEDATLELREEVRKLAGVVRVVKIGATYVAMDAEEKVLATGSIAEIETALV